ncbi:MAG: sigma-70 family RNA polymerase sigma factor [Polyangiaceae bacterium]
MTIRHPARPLEPEPPRGAPLELGEVYEVHFDFVWRSLRRLGVPQSQLEDAAHDVFLVAHRRLAEFEGRSSLKTWLFAIALRVAQNLRRSLSKGGGELLDEQVPTDAGDAPDEQAARSRAVQLGVRLLAELDAEKRAVFVLAELEQLPASEIAEALGLPLFTVYSRLRAARRAFNAAVAREQARGAWRGRWTS